MKALPEWPKREEYRRNTTDTATMAVEELTFERARAGRGQKVGLAA